MPAPDEMTVAQLDRLIGTPNCPAIVDVSTDADFAADPFLIPGAFRHPHSEPQALVARLGGQPVVASCQQGRKLSQGLVAWLRAEGISAHYLSGGMFAWRDTPGSLRVPAAVIPAPIGGATLWVTRHRPKIDRIACPWLIRRFIDPGARFLFVAPAEVVGVAERFGATPFDVEGVHFSHRGETCTFDTMLAEFALSSPALARLALVIRGADTDRHDLHPAAAGLLAISVGLSRQYRDDTAQLQAGIALYDALYRWARDGFDEGHDWPAGRSA
ncbi:sulfurtransferase/chromate resistance protein [Phaeovulum sp.]|uniref:sulfurtransferase/chromate resistance protein n=1 Tax=Phaeovulum sp. TaxID=2934796 RepID=UPI00272F48CC|nr:sulfurtransferase/chromate resistance protein [Phaeovulum sp.]MDP1669580.1 sulfurtransferase/chromate resistance protein [Phaeovulum sp.]MDP3861754.1 sulfurtransferase/chromate resistance protein [Phaeovulum sp.]MDZ4119093.1 sulfurtransferase/chromate resistance protein [Phaeovulum sp.]